MKVKELRSMIEQYTATKNMADHQVEFVSNNKKFFAEDVKAGTDTLEFSITRSNYYPLTMDGLISALKLANGEVEVQVSEASGKKSIKETFLTDSALEIVLE